MVKMGVIGEVATQTLQITGQRIPVGTSNVFEAHTYTVPMTLCWHEYTSTLPPVSAMPYGVRQGPCLSYALVSQPPVSATAFRGVAAPCLSHAFYASCIVLKTSVSCDTMSKYWLVKGMR